MLFIKIQLCPVFDGKRSKIIVSPFNTTFNHKIGHFYSDTHTGMILIIVIYRQYIISFIIIQFISVTSGLTISIFKGNFQIIDMAHKSIAYFR